ncbi:hypothetical protein [Desulfosporosinus hippei]|uniref:Uncharacterized protein n=1 Tax=Desulfosporosinus hippei DSM 8344 TaxID=1121419 RepID=A0A1G8F1N0_9FIRM|nr:hypothetical protein [Desulfosporosinus hippei]SDH76020.1 hypothetical protein SAMN05443529_11875 [Desulfosporosinus hippei DSM 8344]
MATLGKENNLKFVPEGNAQKPRILTPKTNVIAKKTDILNNDSSDPSHR